MLIVCTKDPVVVGAAQAQRSGAGSWGNLVIIDPRFNQAQATTVIQGALSKAGDAEPVCFSAHGNDNEIGDAGTGRNDWGWSRERLAWNLSTAMPRRFSGPILIHACAKNVSNFSAGLAVALDHIRALNGVWIYGYQRAVPSTAGFPDPRYLDRSRELYATQVSYRVSHDGTLAAAAGDGAEAVPQGAASSGADGGSYAGNGVSHASHGDSYHASFPSGYTLDIPVGFNFDEVRRLFHLVVENAR